MVDSDIFFNGLGGSLAGAFVGAFLGSFLQVYYSAKNEQKKAHLLDLKESVTRYISNSNFRLSDFTFEGFRYEQTTLRSNDVLFNDFMTNHYPDIHSKLHSVVRLSLDVAGLGPNLLNRINDHLQNTINDIRPVKFQNLNEKTAVDILADGILSGYDPSFLRVADYGYLGLSVGSSFNAANDQNGKFISGGFLFQTLQLPILQKTGTFSAAIITPSGFKLTGTVSSDALCNTSPGASATLTGPCFPPPGAAGTFQFTASNGEKATISGNVECIIVNQPPPCPENTQGNNNCQGQNNNRQ